MEKTKEIIREYCEENDLELREDYSGRGMYGETCWGIVYEYESDYAIVCELTELLCSVGIRDVSHVLGRIETDSMGRGRILYFKSIY